jgi:hypothetical protein
MSGGSVLLFNDVRKPKSTNADLGVKYVLLATPFQEHQGSR